jgi:alcohol dehydrogenase (NADP+)
MNSFTDAIDASKVPYRTTYTGAKIPAIGRGTFGSDRFSSEVIAEVS